MCSNIDSTNTTKSRYNFYIQPRSGNDAFILTQARDQYTSSTLIGGKGGAGPSSLRTKLEGPTEYVNAQWM